MVTLLNSFYYSCPVLFTEMYCEDFTAVLSTRVGLQRIELIDKTDKTHPIENLIPMSLLKNLCVVTWA